MKLKCSLVLWSYQSHSFIHKPDRVVRMRISSTDFVTKCLLHKPWVNQTQTFGSVTCEVNAFRLQALAVILIVYVCDFLFSPRYTSSKYSQIIPACFLRIANWCCDVHRSSQFQFSSTIRKRVRTSNMRQANVRWGHSKCWHDLMAPSARHMSKQKYFRRIHDNHFPFEIRRRLWSIFVVLNANNCIVMWPNSGVKLNFRFINWMDGWMDGHDDQRFHLSYPKSKIESHFCHLHCSPHRTRSIYSVLTSVTFITMPKIRFAHSSGHFGPLLCHSHNDEREIIQK